jgi:hypothetical protein
VKSITYWYAKCLDDSNSYDIRRRTKQEALTARDAAIADGHNYSKVVNITVEYQDAFDLMSACVDGISEENQFIWTE